MFKFKIITFKVYSFKWIIKKNLLWRFSEKRPIELGVETFVDDYHALTNLGLKTKLAHSTVPKQKFLYFKMDKFKNDVRIALRAPGAEKNEFLDFKPPIKTIWKTPTAPCDDSHRLT